MHEKALAERRDFYRQTVALHGDPANERCLRAAIILSCSLVTCRLYAETETFCRTQIGLAQRAANHRLQDEFEHTLCVSIIDQTDVPREKVVEAERTAEDRIRRMRHISSDEHPDMRAYVMTLGALRTKLATYDTQT